MVFYVISYDVPCDKRRQKIAKLLEGYGQRVQWSVFECCLRPDQFQQLQKRLRRLYCSGEDSIRFYPLHGQLLEKVEIWGGPSLQSSPQSVIV